MCVLVVLWSMGQTITPQLSDVWRVTAVMDVAGAVPSQVVGGEQQKSYGLLMALLLGT